MLRGLLCPESTWHLKETMQEVYSIGCYSYKANAASLCLVYDLAPRSAKPNSRHDTTSSSGGYTVKKNTCPSCLRHLCHLLGTSEEMTNSLVVTVFWNV